MGDSDFEERVRARAYQLWEQEGRPEGQAEAFWHRAASLVTSDVEAGPAPASLAAAGLVGETADVLPAKPLKTPAATKTKAPAAAKSKAPADTKSKSPRKKKEE